MNEIESLILDGSEEQIIEFIEKCLSEGKDINSIWASPGIPLSHIAIVNGYKKAIRLLLEKGADVNVKDENGYTLLCAAVFVKDAELVKTLIGKGAYLTTKMGKREVCVLHMSSFFGTLEIFKILLDAGADLYSKTIEGETVLNTALEAGNDDIADFILEKMEK